VNPSGSRFCDDCGADLTRVVCATCGAISPVGKRFCNGCGSWPDTGSRTGEPGARPAEAGERKQASVLFADVVGSMLLAERLDPERLRAVLAELTRRCAECVTRFEGMTLLCRVGGTPGTDPARVRVGQWVQAAA
jgi:hypothetical protein